MLTGRSNPELGGSPDLLDVIGLNFYDRNQWVHCERTLPRTDPSYRPLRDLLTEVAHRYRKPVMITETGAEDDARAAWFDYVCEEVQSSLLAGVDVRGVCLYPILNHPGWDDDRHCCNGLWDYANDTGDRAGLPAACGCDHKAADRICEPSEGSRLGNPGSAGHVRTA